MRRNASTVVVLAGPAPGEVLAALGRSMNVALIRPAEIRPEPQEETDGLTAAAEAGFVWVNEVARHFPGTPFGGYKQSGTGREECLDELLDFTQQKNIHIRYRPG